MHHLMKKMFILEKKKKAQILKYNFTVISSTEEKEMALSSVNENEFLIIFKLYNE